MNDKQVMTDNEIRISEKLLFNMREDIETLYNMCRSPKMRKMYNGINHYLDEIDYYLLDQIGDDINSVDKSFQIVDKP